MKIALALYRAFGVAAFAGWCQYLYKRDRMSRRRIILLGSLIALIQAPSVFAQSVDWKYFGNSRMGKGDVDLFYEATGIERPDVSTLRVWVKGLPRNKLQSAHDALKPSDEMFDRIVKRIGQYYIPPFGRIHEMKTAMDTEVFIAFEQMADDAIIQPVVRFLYELNCKDGLLRRLSSEVIIAGHWQNSSVASQWEHIPPETNYDSLSKLLCK